MAGFLAESASQHRHLCPRQVLGVRMAMLAGELLQLELPQTGKRLIAIVETDGCFADGISAASGCRVGRRTLRVEDHGKVAAAFASTDAGHAYRLVPRPDVRLRSRDYAPEARNTWEAQLLGYQRMPASELFSSVPVQMIVPLAVTLGQAGVRVCCEGCGEEVINGREVCRSGKVICRACAGEAYWLEAIEPARPPAFTGDAREVQAALSPRHATVP